MYDVIAFEVKATSLGKLVLRNDFITVQHLKLEEIPQNDSNQLGLINILGESENVSGSCIALCVMLVGQDYSGEILWASCLKGAHQENGTIQIFDSLLVSPEVIGKTSTIVIRMYGGKAS